MSIGLNAIAAAAATVLLTGVAGSASAQPEYGYGQLPPPPYQEMAGYAPGVACGGNSFTLVGAHAGVTVLGVDLDAGARLGVPYYSSCGYAAPHYEPRPEAPPQYAYPPPQPVYQSYAPQAYQPQAYQPQPCQQACGYQPMPAPPPQPYYPPCGCEAPRSW